MSSAPINERFCLPIQLDSLDEAVKLINTHETTTRYFELWLDYMQPINADMLQELILRLPRRIICLFRRDKLAEPIMPTDRRHELLELLAKLPVYIDLDISMQSEDLDHLATLAPTAQLICSYHNYSSTPDNLENLVVQMDHYKPEIYKLATYCADDSDAARLIELKSKLMGRNKRSIVLGMGDKGKLARLTCDLWGNELVFAPAEQEHATAPGQISRSEYETLTQILGG